VIVRRIGIAGPSGSGKTTLARAVAEQLPATVLLFADDYYRDLSHLDPQDRAQVDFDDPEAVEHALLAEHLRRLAAGTPVDVPRYDFATHTRAGTHRLAPADRIVVDGLHLLHWDDVRAALDLRVFVDADDALLLARRVARDVAERGRTEDFARWQFETFVRRSNDRFIRPSRAHADIRVDGAAPLDAGLRVVLEALARLD